MKIPKSQEPAFATIVTMADAEFNALREAIKSSAPSISISDFSERVANVLAEESEEVSGLIAMLLGASAAFERSGSELADFVAEVCALAEKSDSEALAAIGNWQTARERLTSLLSLHDTLGLTAKALSVISETERLYCNARIISDLRPIFRIDSSTQVSASVVLHSLRIAFHGRPGEGVSNFFVTMVNEDLILLKAVIDRALQKNETLRTISDRGGVKSIEFKAGGD